MWSFLVVQTGQHVIGGGGGKEMEEVDGEGVSSRQLTLNKGAPGDQVRALLCMQLASCLEGGPLMWVMPLHLHVNQNSDNDMKT